MTADQTKCGHCGLLAVLDVHDECTVEVTARQPENREQHHDDGPKKSQADKLVDLALELYEVGVSESGEPFAAEIRGPRIALMFRGAGGSLRSRLASIYRHRHGKVPSSSALADAMTALEGMALAAEGHTVYLRRAVVGSSVWIDLGRVDGEVIEVTADGWTIRPEPPVLFRRSALTGEMPYPIEGGSIDDLREFVQVDDDGFELLVGLLVSAVAGDHPRPGALFVGEQGTGKTTTARTLVELLDPSPAPVRAAPRDITDWVVVAAGSEVVALDNLSYMPHWLSDALCRAVTGESFPRRRLYSDGDIVVSSFRRTLLLTGIDLGALRGDLLDRLILMELERIPDGDRRPDRAMDSAWQEARPSILGALMTLVTLTLRKLPDIDLDEMPRMADHARVLAALDQATGRRTLSVYLDATNTAQTTVVESDAVAAAVLSMMEHRTEWEGSASDLLALLTGDDRPPKGWPSTAHHLSGRLKRVAPALRKIGLEYATERTEHARTITLTKTDRDTGRPSGASGASGMTLNDADDAPSPPPYDDIKLSDAELEEFYRDRVDAVEHEGES